MSVDAHPLPNRFLVVVRPAFDLRALEQPLHDRFVVDGQRQTAIELDTPSFSRSPSSASAWAIVRGKPSSRKPFLASSSRTSAPPRFRSRSRRDEFAGIHHGLRLQTDRRAGLHRRAQHVARRDMRDSELDQRRCLRALPRTGRARQQYDSTSRSSSESPAHAARRAEALVFSRNQMRFDLPHRIHRHAHDDQQRRSTEVERHAHLRRQPDGQDANPAT